MTQEQILEGNKMIAEFMGFERCPHLDDKKLGECFHRKNPTEALIYISKAKYHSSWDWLMPVVEKIESVHIPKHGKIGAYISSNQCTIEATNFRSYNASEGLYYSQHSGLSKIEASYKACIQFITWYNTQKQS